MPNSFCKRDLDATHNDWVVEFNGYGKHLAGSDGAINALLAGVGRPNCAADA